MTWKNKIEDCFGLIDKKFARDALGKEAAIKLLAQSQTEGIGWKVYIDEIEKWLKSKVKDENHINKEMKEVKKLSNYFKND